MQCAVLALNDGRIGVLVDGRILERKDVLPILTIVTQCNGTRRANTLGRQRQRLEVVVNQRVATILQRDGIRTALVVFNVEQGNRRPRVAIVRREGSGYVRIMRAHRHLQAPVL